MFLDKVVEIFISSLKVELHAQDELAARRIVGTRAGGSRIQSVHLVGGGVHAAELGEGEHVLGGSVEAYFAQVLAAGLEGVAQGQHVQFQVVAPFQEVVRHYGVGVCRDAVVLAVGFLQDVAREVLRPVVEVVDVEDVVTEGSAEEERKVELLVAEVVGHGACEFGKSVAHHLAVVVRGLCGFDDVAVAVIHQPIAVAVYAGIFPHEEVAQAFALLDALQVVEGVGVFRATYSYIVFFLAGFAGTLLLIGLWLLVNGALGAWWRDGFLFNFAYAGDTDMQSRIDILILFVKYRIQWISLLLNVLLLCFYKKDKMLYGANLLYVVVNLVLMSMSGENYSHYKIALLPGFVAPLACGGQILWDSIAGWKKRFRFAEPLVLATLCLAVLFAKDCYRGLLRIYDNINVTEEEAEILTAMDYIMEHTDQNDKIAALGNLCHIYLGTDRYSATDYVYTFPICNILAEMGERFCEQLEEARPKIIVMDPENFLYESEYEKRTAEFLENDYTHLMSGYHFEMYERK